MNDSKLIDLAVAAARAKGAKYPTWASNSSGQPTIVDTETGKSYLVEVNVREIR